MSDALERIDKLVKENRVFLFMKGTRRFPMCGFSAQAVQVLGQCGVEFDVFDVLSDEEIRQGVKEYGRWPTIPQLYVDGQLVGGADIIAELFESGQLKEALAKSSDE